MNTSDNIENNINTNIWSSTLSGKINAIKNETTAPITNHTLTSAIVPASIRPQATAIISQITAIL